MLVIYILYVEMVVGDLPPNIVRVIIHQHGQNMVIVHSYGHNMVQVWAHVKKGPQLVLVICILYVEMVVGYLPTNIVRVIIHQHGHNMVQVWAHVKKGPQLVLVIEGIIVEMVVGDLPPNIVRVIYIPMTKCLYFI
ncbi:hypothetical protein H131_23124 [Lysinibacillus sphaericus OT4b.31]|uniref:Uncharacterized protein n=1 Tax=Lysinibacillus sphaericus OT4b.31 TaxID=1285586 RepID=R7Z7P3_LYSSH|nr:hypothetical protein H131_23124 [Lysinibacillus sphaericus OT4b.31]